MTLAFQTLVNGLALGANFALIALGFAVVYSVLRMFNFAHGDIYMFGVYAMLSLLLSHIPIVFAVLAGMAVAGALAMCVERFGYRPLRNSHPMMGIIMAVAAALVIRQIVILIWGASQQTYPQIIPGHFTIQGVTVTNIQVLVLAVAIAAAVGMTFFLRRTRWGRAILLVRQDLEVARLMGIPVNRVVSLIYAVAGILGAVGGYLFVATYGVIGPLFGFQQTVEAFVAAVLGGIGGLGGAIVGGLALGLVEQFSAAYISTSYQLAIAFGVLVLFLLVRPYGILGTKVWVQGQRV